MKVVNMNFDQSQLIDSLLNRVQNKVFDIKLS